MLILWMDIYDSSLMPPSTLEEGGFSIAMYGASLHQSHSKALNAFLLLAYLAGIDGDFQRPCVCTACNGAPRLVILIASPTRPE